MNDENNLHNIHSGDGSSLCRGAEEDDSAEVWCLSGYLSGQYKMAFHEMK